MPLAEFGPFERLAAGKKPATQARGGCISSDRDIKYKGNGGEENRFSQSKPKLGLHTTGMSFLFLNMRDYCVNNGFDFKMFRLRLIDTDSPLWRSR